MQAICWALCGIIIYIICVSILYILYVCVYIHTYICIIYIYIHREKERERTVQNCLLHSHVRRNLACCKYHAWLTCVFIIIPFRVYCAHLTTWHILQDSA